MPISQSVTEARGVGLMFILWDGEKVFRMLHTHACPVLNDLRQPKEVYLPHSWVLSAHSVSVPGEGLRHLIRGGLLCRGGLHMWRVVTG